MKVNFDFYVLVKIPFFPTVQNDLSSDKKREINKSYLYPKKDVQLCYDVNRSQRTKVY